MSDREIIIMLQQIEEALITILDRATPISSSQEFVISFDGSMRLDSICMKLAFLGEAIKNIDKRTDRALFPLYPVINWRNIMGLRDIIVHQYLHVDEEIIFDIVKNKIPEVLTVIQQIIKDKS